MINLDFNSVIQLVKAFPNEQICIDHLTEMRWNGNVISPFDQSSKVYTCKDNKYRCKNTGKYFNVRTATLFDNTKVDLLTWFIAIHLLTGHKKGISSIQLSKDLNVTQKTAWFMTQRIRACFGLTNDDTEIGDDVQLDETFVGGKNKNRHRDKKVAQSQGRSFKDKTPVLGMLSKGTVKAFVIESTSAKNIKPLIFQEIKPNATIISDEWCAYTGLDKYYDHQVVDHNRKQYVNDCGFTTNAIEGFWSILKRGIIGIYHLVSRKHLQRYVDEFVFRYNSRDISDSIRFNFFLSRINYRLTYKSLIGR